MPSRAPWVCAARSYPPPICNEAKELLMLCWRALHLTRPSLALRRVVLNAVPARGKRAQLLTCRSYAKWPSVSRDMGGPSTCERETGGVCL